MAIYMRESSMSPYDIDCENPLDELTMVTKHADMVRDLEQRMGNEPLDECDAKHCLGLSEQVLELDGTVGDYHYLKGTLEFGNRSLHQAYTHFRAAVHTSPREEEYWAACASVLRERRELRRLHRTLKHLRRRHPAAHYDVSFATNLCTLEQYRRGLRHLERALKRWEGQISATHRDTAMYYRGSVHFALEEYAEALACATQCLKTDPHDVFTIGLFVRIYTRLEQFDKARQIVRDTEASPWFPKCEWTAKALLGVRKAQLLSAMGDTQEATALFEYWRQTVGPRLRERKLCWLFYHYGRHLHERLQLVPDARDLYELSIQGGRSHYSWYHFHLARALHALGKTSQARKHLDHARTYGWELPYIRREYPALDADMRGE